MGKVYESLGSLEQALPYYQLSVQGGQHDSLNDLGRLYINRVNPITRKVEPTLAEATLLLGLQRAQMQQASTVLIYELRRNIGWALLNQKKYVNSQEHLDLAISLEEKITEKKPGAGMAYCFLAQVYEEQRDKEKAIPLWQKCMEKALPEFIHEYKWLSDVKQDAIAYCVDTQNVTSGYNGKKNRSSQKLCSSLYDELNTELKSFEK